MGARRRRLLGTVLVSACALGCLGVGVGLATSAGPAAAQTNAAMFTPVPGTPFPLGINNFPNAVAYSPSGGLLATANSGYGSVSVFSIASDGSLIQAPGSPYPISYATALAFSSSGVLAVTAGEDIYTYTVADNGSLTPTPDSPFVDPSADYTSLAFSRNGQTLVTGEGGGPYFDTFSVAANGTVTPTNNGNVHYAPYLPSGGVAFSPSGLLAIAGANDVSLYTIGANGTVTLAPGSPVATGGSSASSVAFAPGGQLAVANAGSNTVSTFTVAANGSLTPAPGSPYPTGNAPNSVAFDATGDMAVTNYDDNTVSLFSIAANGSLTQQPGSPYATGPNPDSAAFSPDNLLAVGDSGGGGVSGEVSEFASSAVDVALQFPSSDPIVEPDGHKFTETMTVQNNGTAPTTAPSVMQLYKPANSGLSIINLNGGQLVGQTITWAIPVLQPGQTVTDSVTLEGTSTASGTVQLTGSTPVPLDDADPGNDSAILPITLSPGG